MYPKQGTKEPGEGESGSVKRDTRDTLRDQSGPVPVLLLECLCVSSCFLKNKQKQRLDHDSGTKRNDTRFCDPGERNVGVNRWPVSTLLM